jgi:hypothetical protein
MQEGTDPYTKESLIWWPSAGVLRELKFSVMTVCAANVPWHMFEDS